MRNALCTGFLVAIATVSAAQSSPITRDTSAPREAVSRADVAVTRSEGAEISTQRTQSEGRQERAERQVLSKNFQSSKPVQIYWFFGGR